MMFQQVSIWIKNPLLDELICLLNRSGSF
jgi:hypothetical protein